MKKILLIGLVLLVAFSQIAWKGKTHKDITAAAYKALRVNVRARLSTYNKDIVSVPKWSHKGGKLVVHKKKIIKCGIVDLSRIPDAYRVYSVETGSSDANNPYRIPNGFRKYLKKDYYMMPNGKHGHNFDNASAYGGEYASAARAAYLEKDYKATLYFMGIAAHFFEDAACAVHISNNDHFSEHAAFEADAKAMIKHKKIIVRPDPSIEFTKEDILRFAHRNADDEFKRWQKGRKRHVIDKGIGRAVDAVYIMFSEVTAKKLLDVTLGRKRNTSFRMIKSINDSFKMDKEGVANFYLTVADKYRKKYKLIVRVDGKRIKRILGIGRGSGQNEIHKFRKRLKKGIHKITVNNKARRVSRKFKLRRVLVTF